MDNLCVDVYDNFKTAPIGAPLACRIDSIENVLLQLKH